MDKSTVKFHFSADSWLIIALTALVSIAFIQSCSFPIFEAWDDNIHVTDNRHFLRFSLENLLGWWRQPFCGFYMPLTMWSYMFDYNIWGLNGFGYHLQNIFWHVLAVIGVFKCFRILGVQRSTAFVSCLIFAIHPQKVEPVVWVSGRKDVVCAAFYFWSLYCYFRTPDKSWPKISFILSL